MKILSKRLLPLLLAVLMLCCTVPFAVQSGAVARPSVAQGNIANRIAQLLAAFPVGSYFSADGKACVANSSIPGNEHISTNMANTVCNNCRLSYIMPSMGYPDTMGITDSWTCVSFARYAFYYIFGVVCDNLAYDGSVPTDGIKITDTSQAKPGDIMVFSGHYALCLGNNRYFQVNVGGTSIVSFNATYGGTKQYILRAKNYDKINQDAKPAPATGNVAARLAQVGELFPNGSYFSTNGYACADADCDGCSNCALSGILPSLGYTGGLNGINECYQGVAFARFLWWYVFGVAYNQSAYTGAAPTGAHLVPTSEMKPGDLVVFNVGIAGQRVGIYLGDGKYAFGNYNLSNKVSYGIALPSGLTATYVFRADNYDTVNYTPYAITVTSGTADKTEYEAGETVTLTASAAPGGKRFKEWVVSPTVTFTGGTSATDATAKFTMPAAAVSAEATYEPIPPTKYNVTVISGTADQTQCEAGTTVTLTASAALSGKRFKEWVVSPTVTFTGGTSATDATAKFTMPAAAVSAEATYEPIPPTKYTVTVSAGKGGGDYAEGEIVTVTALEITPTPTSKRFKKWVFTTAVTFTDGTGVTDATAKFIMPAGPVKAEATYEEYAREKFAVTVLSGGNGTASANQTMAIQGDQIVLTASPASGYRFKEWQVTSGGVTVVNNKFTMPGNDVTVKAIFEKDTKYIKLWGVTTKFVSDFGNWLLCIFLFGWIWMVFVK